jgi:hypothetical protein
MCPIGVIDNLFDFDRVIKLNFLYFAGEAGSPKRTMRLFGFQPAAPH